MPNMNWQSWIWHHAMHLSVSPRVCHAGDFMHAMSAVHVWSHNYLQQWLLEMPSNIDFAQSCPLSLVHVCVVASSMLKMLHASSAKQPWSMPACAYSCRQALSARWSYDADCNLAGAVLASCMPPDLALQSYEATSKGFHAGTRRCKAHSWHSRLRWETTVFLCRSCCHLWSISLDAWCCTTCDSRRLMRAVC